MQDSLLQDVEPLDIHNNPPARGAAAAAGDGLWRFSTKELFDLHNRQIAVPAKPKRHPAHLAWCLVVIVATTQIRDQLHLNHAEQQTIWR